MVWNVCCSHSQFCNAIVFCPLFGTCMIYKNKMVPKVSLSKWLKIKIGCSKIHQSSFISTNKAGKNIERYINIPLLNTPLSHVVTKFKKVWLPRAGDGGWRLPPRWMGVGAGVVFTTKAGWGRVPHVLFRGGQF
jgi:hypothetical protein